MKDYVALLNHYSPEARRKAAELVWFQAPRGVGSPPGSWRTSIDNKLYCPLGVLNKFDGLSNDRLPRVGRATRALTRKPYARVGSTRHTAVFQQVDEFIFAIDHGAPLDIKALLLGGLS